MVPGMISQRFIAAGELKWLHWAVFPFYQGMHGTGLTKQSWQGNEAKTRLQQNDGGYQP